MNNRQAIEVLKDFDSQVTEKADGAYQSTVGKMACDLAIAALERRIPKKPICDNLYACPTCHTIMLQRIFESKEKYCKECGQLIDWSKK